MQTKYFITALGLFALGSSAVGQMSSSGGVGTVTGVDVKTADAYTGIIVTASEPFTPTIDSLDKYSATVITVPGQYEAGPFVNRTIERNDVNYIRYGADSVTAEPTVRIVASTRGSLPISTRSYDGGRRWEIRMWKHGATPVADAPTPESGIVPPAPARTVSDAAPVSLPPARAAFQVAQVTAAREASAPAAAPAPVVKAAPSVKPMPAAKAARPAVVASTAGTNEPTAVAMDDRRISLDFVAADINDVIKALALQGNVNIVTAADVKGNVTVSLQRVTVTEALDMVARLSGYQYARHGSAYIVGSRKSVDELVGVAPVETPKPVENVTELIPYRFVRTADLGGALESRFPGMRMSTGDAKADEKATPSTPRLLVVTDTPERVAQAREFVAKLEQAATFPAVGSAVEIYRIKYAAPGDLMSVLARLAPTVQVALGPSQGFQPGSTGATASFQQSATPATSGGAAAAPEGGTANPAGAVASGSAPNALILSGEAADIARARQLLEQVDVRVPQMTFEAKVVDVNNTDLSKIGLTYDFGRTIQIGEQNHRDAGTSPSVGQLFNENSRPMKFGAIMRSPYTVGVNLDLLAKNNKARVLANPNLSALDGQPAVVFIGDQIKYVINREVTPTGTNIQTETATVGITLKVTGKASPDGMITLYVHPEVSVISGYLQIDGGISLPQIASRYVDTTIRVKDGETIAIGGLIRESDIVNIQKVPFLGDLPFLGQLFRRTEKNKEKSEVVVFITSRILKD